MSPELRNLVDRVADRAENLYRNRHLHCAESILVACNEVFRGGLNQDQAVGIAAGMGAGLSDSGCLCGALNGGVLSLGLILPGNRPNRDRKRIRNASRDLHNQFKNRFNSTCCRVLIKNVKHDPKEHFEQCAGITKEAAGMTASMLLELKPQLAEQAAGGELPKLESPMCGRIKWLLNWVCR
jgi:C_GCAxxG_C_C family probable redox protein